ncbi:MAG: SMC-Scp complex subunit ScpB [Planctomycetaceae bacterium]|jgi:segregation and condensation protein B|nr:SMC-Scp complex subunit ScpB [Planctomycetaceae bacterium]
MIHPFNICRVQDKWLCCSDASRINKLNFLYDKDTTEAKRNISCNKISYDNFDGVDDKLSVSDSRMDFLLRVEAVLFLSREPLTLRRIAMLAELPEGLRVKQILRELNQRYDKQRTAFCIVEVAGGVQLRTRAEFASWLLRIQESPVIVRLSSPAMETLAVIAYKQPVHRAEIEKLRGVQCGDLIRQLLEKNLVKIVGRSEELGRPFFYGTTKYFQQIFGLKNINDLPDYETLSKKNQDTENM